MLKSVLIVALVAAAYADVLEIIPRTGSLPQRSRLPVSPYASAGPQIPILRQSQDIQPDGSYEWSYETGNGIAAQEQAQEHPVGPEQSIKSAQGSYGYTSPEGEVVQVSYVADENGFRPQGSHIPVAPPVPPAIARALEWIAAHPQKPERQF